MRDDPRLKSLLQDLRNLSVNDRRRVLRDWLREVGGPRVRKVEDNLAGYLERLNDDTLAQLRRELDRFQS